MPGNPHINCAHTQVFEIARENASMREVIAKAIEILSIPVPDTFLGRRTHEPFPEDEEAQIANWMASKACGPPKIIGFF